MTGHSHDYKRNGTSTLFAAFEVATGKVTRIRDEGLIELASVVDAVHCDLAVQEAMAERDATVPTVQWIGLFFGINVGDVIDNGRDIFCVHGRRVGEATVARRSLWFSSAALPFIMLIPP